VLPLEAPPGLAADAPLRVRLELTAPGLGKVGTLRGWFPGAVEGGGAVTVELDGRGPAPEVAPPLAAQRGPSFFVDYDEPAVAPFRAAVAALGVSPADADLARLVDGWIVKKNMTRGIDPASRVARRREGDCSEHAVLLAAAARLAGRPSRIVLGVALLPVDGRLRAFGHAWAEIHDGTAWRTADATPLPAGARYLPLGVLSDEGPGYLAAAWAGLSPLDVRRIVIAAGR
jgi:transglutaminase-like putative cysteine protease